MIKHSPLRHFFILGQNLGQIEIAALSKKLKARIADSVVIASKSPNPKDFLEVRNLIFEQLKCKAQTSSVYRQTAGISEWKLESC